MSDTPDTSNAPEVQADVNERELAEQGNAKLEHTAGGAHTRDGMDAGVPMLPGQPDEPVGPEDAFGPGPKRGDYSDRAYSGPALVSREVPLAEREKRAEELAKAAKGDTLTAADLLAEVPAYELVPQSPLATIQGDEPGKGGVPAA